MPENVRKRGIKTTKRLSWHPAFAEAAREELVDYLDALEFDFEHHLNTEPLIVDMLIIKKTTDVVIEKNIGAIFRRCNILEYKSPTDTLSISDYHKVMAYAYLYMFLENMKYPDMTVTFVSYRWPREVIKYLKEAGCTVEQQYPGILYVTGPVTVMPMQIIVSRKLDANDNLWLGNLSSAVNAENILKISKTFSKMDGIAKTRVLAYMDILTRANAQTVKEADGMARTAKPTLEDVLEELGYTTAWEARGSTRGKIEAAIALVNDGDSVERAARITGIPVEELEGYLQ